MDEKTRQDLENQLENLKVQNSVFMARVGMPPVPAIAPGVPVPIPMDMVLNPYLDAMRKHGEDFDRLLRIVESLLNDGA
jgi:hypothetical protein